MGGTLLGGIMPFTFLEKNDIKSKFRLKKFLMTVIIVLGVFLSSGCTKKSDEIVWQNESLIDSSMPNKENISTDSVSFDAGASKDSFSADSATNNTSSNKIAVYVCGAVCKSGVYELDINSRIVDAIEAAGGFSKEADTEFLNLAQILSDGCKIKIPTVKESKELLSKENDFGVTSKNQIADNTDLQNSEVCEKDKAEIKESVVNINTASATELMTLKGIGKSRAEAIIQYRTQNGSFAKIEDLMKVTGIKQKMFDKIKNNITV